jgi:hypothetical protein
MFDNGSIKNSSKYGQGTINKIIRILSILIPFLLVFISISGSVVAGEDGNDNAGLGWILFYITLVVLIIIIILWIITYVIMHGVIKRLESKHDKIVRYEERKEADKERKYKEHARDEKRKARAPKGKCTVCNRNFIPGADAYQCECGKFIHVHCLADMSLCPHCGREIDKEYGIVRIEESEGRSGGQGGTRTQVRRLLKAKFCPVCNKIIKAGDSGMQCDRCEAVMHMKCSDKAKTCPKCGA